MPLPKRELIIHCSDSVFGDADLIDDWHRGRGWRKIGYNYIILNGCRNRWRDYHEKDDGFLETGRDIDEKGAHCQGHNDAIGVCLIGKQHFTSNQLFKTLPQLITDLSQYYDLEIYGHYEFSDKTCPNIDVEAYKAFILGGSTQD